jgi:hypothetical protein
VAFSRHIPRVYRVVARRKETLGPVGRFLASESFAVCREGIRAVHPGSGRRRREFGASLETRSFFEIGAPSKEKLRKRSDPGWAKERL